MATLSIYPNKNSRNNCGYGALILLLLLAAGGCTERMTIHTDNQNPRLVVEAFVSNEHKTQEIILSKTMGFFGGETATGATGAIVSIESSNGTVEHFSESPNEPGVYLSSPNYGIEPGEHYVLKIAYGDQVYTAEQTAPHPVHQSQLTAGRYMFLTGLGDTSHLLPPMQLRSVFERTSADVYIGSDFYYGKRKVSAYLSNYNFRQATSPNTSQARIQDTVNGYSIAMQMPLNRNVDTIRPCPFDTVSIVVHTITQETYRFLETARTEMSGGNPLFSGPPANVASNIEGGAVGIFALYCASEKLSIPLPINIQALENRTMSIAGRLSADEGWVHKEDDLEGRTPSIRLIFSAQDSTAGTGTPGTSGRSVIWSDIRIDETIRGFKALDKNSQQEVDFSFNSYNEFVDLRNGQVWVRVVQEQSGRPF